MARLPMTKGPKNPVGRKANQRKPAGWFYFYLLRCKDGSLYSGMARDLKQREAMHNSGRGSAYVRSRGGGKIIYSERFRQKGRAMRREAEVKRLSRAAKLALVWYNEEARK